MTAGSTPEQLEQAFRATEAGGDRAGRHPAQAAAGHRRWTCSPKSGSPAATGPCWCKSNEQLEDRDLVLAAGLTCRISSGCIEVVAGPQTERQLFCTLLADLLSQLPLATGGAGRSAGAPAGRLAADAQPRPASRAAPDGADRPVRRTPRPA